MQAAEVGHTHKACKTMQAGFSPGNCFSKVRGGWQRRAELRHGSALRRASCAVQIR